MKIFGFEFSRERRTAPGTAEINVPYTYDGGMGLLFGGLYSQQSAMAISAVYRATELISDSVAMMPIEVSIDGKYVPDHPIYSAFDNNIISRYTLLKMLIQSVLLRGNGFAYITRNADGTPKAIRFLEAQDVEIHYNKERQELYYTCKQIGSKHIERCNMIHLLKNSYDGVTGLSIINYASKSIKNAQYTESASINYFENGCNLSGILTVNGNLSPQQRIDIKNSWNSAYTQGGSGLAILPGNMNYQSVQMNASDAQLLESRKYNVEDIARFFGISPVLLGSSATAAYSTIEACQQEFLIHTVQPYVALVEAEFSRKLLLPSERQTMKITLDETSILRSDKSATATYFTSLVMNGILTRNEAREALGYASVEGGDTLQIAYSDTQQNTIENNHTENE